MKNLTDSIVYENPAVCEVSLTNDNNQETKTESKHYHNSSTPVQTRHLKEWTEKSGVREDIALSCLESLDDPSEIATRLGWKGYHHTSGWWVSGIDLKTGERAKFGQFKPDEPIYLSAEDDKPAKYITPKKQVTTYDGIALPVRDWQIVIADPSIAIVETEGAKKVGAGETCGYPTVGVAGVEMGLIKGKLVPNLDILAVQGRPWTFAFDSDILNKKEVQNALKKQASILKRRGVVVFVATWEPELGKGIDDVLANHGQEKVQEIMENAVPYSTWLKNLNSQVFGVSQSQASQQQIPDGYPKRWDVGSLGNWLRERYRKKLAWDTSIKEWRRYSATIEGIWEIEPCEFVKQVIKAEITTISPYYQTQRFHPTITPGLIEGIEKLMKWDLSVRQWNQREGVIPVVNGVLDLKTRHLSPHSPANRLTWCLPYEYNPLALCDPIEHWLLEMTQGERALVQLLRAYLHGIVTGRTDWQKYLEMIGPGGTGKSTFIRLAIALVGQQNVHTTELKKLEGNRFETASIKDKRLVVITDSERYTGSVATLKALTGQDLLPYEEKFKQSTGGFTPTALVIVAANEIIQSGDYTSGLGRRRMTVPMNQRIKASEQRNLIEHRNGKIEGEFVPYLPGLLNWVLGMNPDEATDLIKNSSERVPSLAKRKRQALIETNPIAEWVDMRLIYTPGVKTQVGIGDPSQADYQLYANYVQYCRLTGNNPLSLRRFSGNLEDFCVSQMSWKVSRTRNSKGRYFVGLKIRDLGELGDDDLPPVTGEWDEPPIPPEPETLVKSSDGSTTKGDELGKGRVTNDDGSGDGWVTDGDGLSDGSKCLPGLDSDGSDGLIQKVKTIQSIPSQSLSKISQTNKNNENNPSHPSSSAQVSVPSVMPLVTAAAGTVITPVISDSESSVAVDYASYPHLTSDDLRAKEKQANRCRQQMLACSNREEMSTFKQDSGFSESEIKWVYDHALTPSEQEQFQQAATLDQLSLLSKSPQKKDDQFVFEWLKVYQWDDLIAEIERQMSRLGWSTEQGRQYLLDTYGVKSRQKLNDEQLLEFLEYLKNCSSSRAHRGQ